MKAIGIGRGYLLAAFLAVAVMGLVVFSGLGRSPVFADGTLPGDGGTLPGGGGTLPGGGGTLPGGGGTLPDPGIHVKFDGVDGDSTDPGYIDWSDVEKVQKKLEKIAEPKPGKGNKNRIEKMLSKLRIAQLIKVPDSSDPALAAAADDGTMFDTVNLNIDSTLKDGTVVRIAYEFENVQIDKYRDHGKRLALSFDKVNLTVTSYNENGTVADTDTFSNTVESKKKKDR
ncbi:MAG: hypothetical protein FJ319_07315 [SAR202 cluster bacterium]|nr:hypothetical protein [SAR202 cluster bacterium]